MSHYLVLLKSGHTKHDDMSEEERGIHHQQWAKYLVSLKSQDAFIGGGPLGRSGKILE